MPVFRNNGNQGNPGLRGLEALGSPECRTMSNAITAVILASANGSQEGSLSSDGSQVGHVLIIYRDLVDELRHVHIDDRVVNDGGAGSLSGSSFDSEDEEGDELSNSGPVGLKNIIQI